MSLKDKLEAFRARFEPQLPQEVLAQMHQATRDLRASGILNNAISIGSSLPSFELENQDGKTISSGTLLADGPLIISFFRGGWCPYCVIELNALSDIARDVRAAGGNIVVISPQTTEKSKAVHMKESLHLDVLSDPGNVFARSLGIVFSLPPNIQSIYSQLGGFALPDYNGDESWTLPMPTRLVVGQNAQVQYAEVDADYTIRPEPSETLAALRSLANVPA